MQRSILTIRQQTPESKTTWLLYILLLFSYLITTNTYSCTIFYSSQNGIILAGNNEDWKDPDTHMWFYPATDSTFGWVKFGFGSGFPQGGMNEYGMFWDGTSNPYLEMPESEANKILFDGPLMQKVITESANTTEALEIFNQYYCEDQYRAQYLVGDSSGHSMIIEGDNVIHKENTFQVLTNFYQSQPDLGGYPCWRYETATEQLQNCDSLSSRFAGFVLSSTHQEGKYPTQYSNIYDLKNGNIYLFYYHNYEEFLLINLNEELENGFNSYTISRIFSEVRVKKSLIGSTSVTLKWKGLPNSQYEILFSTDPDFTETFISCYNQRSSLIYQTRAAIIIPLIFIVSLLILNSKNNKWLPVSVIICLFLLVNCDKEDTEKEETDNTIEFTKVIEELQPETTYYWKIKSSSGYCDKFITETATHSFKTLSQ